MSTQVNNYNTLDVFKAGTKAVNRVINRGNVLWNNGSTGRDQRMYPVQMYFDETGNPASDRFSGFSCTTALDDVFDQTGLGLSPSLGSVALNSTNQGVLRTSNCSDAMNFGDADVGVTPSGCGAVNINTAAHLPTVNASPQPHPYPGFMGFQFWFKWEDGYPPPAGSGTIGLCGFTGTGDLAYSLRLVVQSVAGNVATCTLQAWSYTKSTNTMSNVSVSAPFDWTFSEWYSIAMQFRFEPPNRNSFQGGCDQWIFSMYGGNAGTNAPDLSVNSGAWIPTTPILDKAGYNSASPSMFGNVVLGGQLGGVTADTDWMVKGLLFDIFFSWHYSVNWVGEPLIPDWFFTVEQSGTTGNHCILFTQADPREDFSGDINLGYECQRYQSGVYENQFCGPATSTYSPSPHPDTNRILSIQAGYNGVGGAGTPFASYSNWNIRRKGDTEWQYFASPTPVRTAYAGVMEENGSTQEQIAEELEGVDEEQIKSELAKISEDMGLYIVKLDCKLPEDYDELYLRVKDNFETLKERINNG